MSAPPAASARDGAAAAGWSLLWFGAAQRLAVALLLSALLWAALWWAIG